MISSYDCCWIDEVRRPAPREEALILAANQQMVLGSQARMQVLCGSSSSCWDEELRRNASACSGARKRGGASTSGAQRQGLAAQKPIGSPSSTMTAGSPQSFLQRPGDWPSAESPGGAVAVLHLLDVWVLPSQFCDHRADRR